MAIDAARLQTILLTSGLQQQNPPLYQVINSLIKGLASISGGSSSGGSVIINNNTIAGNSMIPGMSGNDGDDGQMGPPGVAGRNGTDADASATLLTVDDETASYPNSIQELAGLYITFDDSVPNERTVSSPEWSVLTDGAGNIIYAAGDVVMTHTP